MKDGSVSVVRLVKESGRQLLCRRQQNQNVGDPDRSIGKDHCGTIHIRFLSHSHMYMYIYIFCIYILLRSIKSYILYVFRRCAGFVVPSKLQHLQLRSFWMESRLEARPSHTCAERPDDHQLVRGSNGDFPMGFTARPCSRQ